MLPNFDTNTQNPHFNVWSDDSIRQSILCVPVIRSILVMELGMNIGEISFLDLKTDQ